MKVCSSEVYQSPSLGRQEKNEACLDQPGSLYDYYYMCGLEMLTHLK